MFEVNTAVWIAIALLTPFWWGLGLLILALLGDMSPWWRPRVSRLFDWLEHTRAESPNEPALSSPVAASQEMVVSTDVCASSPVQRKSASHIQAA